MSAKVHLAYRSILHGGSTTGLPRPVCRRAYFDMSQKWIVTDDPSAVTCKQCFAASSVVRQAHYRKAVAGPNQPVLPKS